MRYSKTWYAEGSDGWVHAFPSHHARELFLASSPLCRPLKTVDPELRRAIYCNEVVRHDDAIGAWSHYLKADLSGGYRK